jgi:FkbM family methyltransferase
MTEPDQPSKTSFEELQTRFAKLQRRQKRNERAAWAEGFLTAVCGMLKPGDVVIDCGANVGDVSAPLLATGADVIAFDPEPWAVEKLKKRFEGEPRYTLHNAAVGLRDGAITLMRAENFSENAKGASVKSTVVGGGRKISKKDGDSVEVEQIDFVRFLQGLIRERGEIAFIKMDIEGAELELLPAMDKAGVFDSIRCVVVETHEQKFRELRPAFKKIRAQFAEKYAPNHVNLNWI